VLHESADGQEGWNGGEYHGLFALRDRLLAGYFADSKGNKVERAQYGNPKHRP